MKGFARPLPRAPSQPPFDVPPVVGPVVVWALAEKTSRRPELGGSAGGSQQTLQGESMTVSTPLLPVNVQRDEDAALGAAWRRAQAAAGRDDLVLTSWDDGESRWHHATSGRIANDDGDDSPTAALTALAEALEARKAGE